MYLYYCLVPKMANAIVLWVIVYFCVTSVNTKDYIVVYMYIAVEPVIYRIVKNYYVTEKSHQTSYQKP